MAATAAYNSRQVQGDVLPGFRARKDTDFHQTFLFGRIHDLDAARAALCELRDQISAGGDVYRSPDHEPRPPFVNIALTYEGVKQLGGDDWANAFAEHEAFREGLANRSIKERLLGDPARWKIGRPGQHIDVLVNVGSPNEDVAATVEGVRAILDRGFSCDQPAPINGAMLPGGTEHFGFRDGIAQPYVDDPARPVHRLRARYAPRPDGPRTRARGKAAYWPDWDDERPDVSKTLPNAPKLPLAFHSPGVPVLPAARFVVPSNGADDLTANGSFMVWLKLRQYPDRFWAMCDRMAKGLHDTWDDDINADVAGALLMGRGLDGTPVEPSPPTVPEDFGYFEDQSARRCPAGAHIRLMNPRDVQSLPQMILRRGIPYGPPLKNRYRNDGRNRGLLFICYQRSIDTQYEVLQRKFANGEYELTQATGQFADPIISQQSREGTTLEIAEPYGGGSYGTRLRNTWVVPEGGLYLFVPSIQGLNHLAGCA